MIDNDIMPTIEKAELLTKEEYEQKMRLLVETYSSFLKYLDEEVLSPENVTRMTEKIHVGKIDNLDESMGLSHGDCQVVYADWTGSPLGRCKEGSLYTRFGDDTLRIRWADGSALFLNDVGNYIDGTSQKDEMGEEVCSVIPKRINGLKILDTSGDMVELEHPDAIDYLLKKNSYDRQQAKKAEKAEKDRKLSSRIKGLFYASQELVIELSEPVEPERVFIPFKVLADMIDKVTLGLKKTAETLSLSKES